VALAACSTGTAGRGGGSAAPSTPSAATSPAPATVTVTAPAPSSSTAPLSFSALYARQQSGVVRIETVGCSDAGVGTGFLVSPNYVLTVAHVVDQAVVISLRDGAQRTTGAIVGIDRGRDLALVKSARPLHGYQFQLSPRLPAVGDDVAAIGFPIGDPITFTRGNISGLHRNITVDGRPRRDMIETDAAVNPGNSGGPLIGQDGLVYGLVDAKNTQAEGIAFAVPATQAAAYLPAWRGAPEQPAADCGNPLGPGGATTSVPSLDGLLNPAAANGIAAAFTTYFDGINSGDYRVAWNVLSPRRRATSSYRSFAQGDATSYDSDIQVLDAKQLGPDTATVALSFMSLQRADKGPDGDTCDVWTLNYTLIRDSAGTWYIDNAEPYGGSSHTTC
jgi:S1-C subfamily serine protease